MLNPLELKPGQEQYESFSPRRGWRRVQYDYRFPSGELFSCVAKNLEDARAKRDFDQKLREAVKERRLRALTEAIAAIDTWIEVGRISEIKFTIVPVGLSNNAAPIVDVTVTEKDDLEIYGDLGFESLEETIVAIASGLSARAT